MLNTKRLMTAALWLLILMTVAGLAIDAYVHFDLASTYDPVGNSITQGDLFRAESSLAILAAVALMLRPRRYTAAFATVVAGAGAAALFAYRYYDIGKLGPVPDMYEPFWYPEKSLAAWAEVAATVTGAATFAVEHLRLRLSRTPSSPDGRLGHGSAAVAPS
jgi:hypothetical protein